MRGFQLLYLVIPDRNCHRLSRQILGLWSGGHCHIYNIRLKIALLWRRNEIWFLTMLTTTYRRFSYISRTELQFYLYYFFVTWCKDSISPSIYLRQYSIFYDIKRPANIVICKQRRHLQPEWLWKCWIDYMKYSNLFVNIVLISTACNKWSYLIENHNSH